jgi:hypothetical protein
MKLDSRLILILAIPAIGPLLAAVFFGAVGWRTLALISGFVALTAVLNSALRPRGGMILAAAALLPTLVYIGFAVLNQPAWDFPAPLWSLNAEGRSASCTAILAPVSGGTAAEVKDTSRATVPAERAVLVSDAAIFNAAPLEEILAALLYLRDGPRLIEAVFPDGRTRLAWYTVRTSYGRPVTGFSSVVYVDAQSGDALMLIRDVVALADVQFECGRTAAGVGNPYAFTLTRLSLGQLALSAYLGMLVGVGLLRVLWLVLRGRR